MKIQTLSIVVGDSSCNARCPYCVSKMTAVEAGKKLIKPNYRNLKIACRYAKAFDVSTILLTGKGEPTLHPDQITDYLMFLDKYEFPFIELQTNGLVLHSQEYRRHLQRWYGLGMTTVCLSIVHYLNKKNKEIFKPIGQDYPDLIKTIEILHNIGFSVRLTCMMMKGYIDEPVDIDVLVECAKHYGAEQLTIRGIERPNISRNKEISKWVEDHYISKQCIQTIRSYLDENAVRLMTLPHGAIIYDYKDQNLCLNNCLTLPKDESIRQLIFFPDGHLMYDWQYKGAILL